MGIVVCICMLLGLSVLQPTPWDSAKRASLHSKFVLFTAVALLAIGTWNVVYGAIVINGFWFFASIISGVTMVLAGFYVLAERSADVDNAVDHSDRMRKVVVIVLALSFVLYAVTIIQLNMGYPILR